MNNDEISCGDIFWHMITTLLLILHPKLYLSFIADAHRLNVDYNKFTVLSLREREQSVDNGLQCTTLLEINTTFLKKESDLLACIWPVFFHSLNYFLCPRKNKSERVHKSHMMMCT